MEWIEVSARTLDEAKELALDRLGVVEDELEFEVMQEPKGGVFGLGFGRVDARIRARVRPISREKPTDRRRRNRPARGRDGGRRRGGRASAEGGTSPNASPDPAARSTTEPAPRAGGTRSNQGSRRRRSRSNAGAAATVPVSRPEQEDNTVDDHDDRDDLTIEEQASSAHEFASGLVDAFGLDASVDITVGDDVVELAIDGSDLGILVGPKGATLSAVEELTRAVVQHATSGQSARIHVDVAGYRQRRREALAEFTRGLAEQVRTSGEERALEPMSPPDRKVVHDTVAELDGVATVSVGEDTRRRVVIRPA